jgi:hypothetical protein
MSLLGGFNKIVRNIVAGASDTEFEKVITFYLNFMFTEINKSDISFGQ